MKTLLRETIETLQAIEQGKPWQYMDGTKQWIDSKDRCIIDALRCGCRIRAKPKIIRQELAFALLEAAREMTIHWYDCDKTPSEVCRARALRKAVRNIDEDQ